MTLDPQARFILDLAERSTRPLLESLDPPAARLQYAEMVAAASGEPPAGVLTEESTIPGPDGELPTRLYRPQGAKGPLPILIFFHGGGYVIGDRDTHDIPCRQLCLGAACLVVSVDYRLAPEHPFPVPVDDVIILDQVLANLEVTFLDLFLSTLDASHHQSAFDRVIFLHAKAFQEAGCIVGVNNASFQVQKGDLLVVMGLSGSGKSTLLRCTSRLTDATSGNIYIDGEDLLAMSNKKLIELRRNKMGMVFQSFALLPHKTVLENIAFPLQIKGNSTEESIKRAKDMVDLVGLDGRENYFPRELSGGQQQRVGIARSLAVEPDIWFLDEPFSALDPLIRKEMQDEFMRLQGVLNKTILFVTHDFDEALRLADRIAIMKDGIIEQLDTPANIVLNPATEYVRKFTEEVPREKVLRIESVMDPVDTSEVLSDLKVSKDAIIETVAEAVLGQDKPVVVVDADNNVVGAVHSSKVIHVLFGSRAKTDNKD